MSITFDGSKTRHLEQIKRVAGPVICELLEEPDVIEIALNPDGRLWVERLGQNMTCIGIVESSRAEMLIDVVAQYFDATITAEHPYFEGVFPINGGRFQALIYPAVASPVFSIRMMASKIFTLADYVASGYMSETQKNAIESAVLQRKNILVVGGTGSGKTTLTNAIIQSMVKQTPDDRLVILEDTPEIQCSAPNHVMLRTTEIVDMLRLLRMTMRLRPDRILVGEVRGPEALALLKAWNTGHPGGVCTIHANNALAGLIRMEQLIAEISQSPMSRLIATAVDLVVFIAKAPNGRRIEQIISVEAFDGKDYVFEEI